MYMRVCVSVCGWAGVGVYVVFCACGVVCICVNPRASVRLYPWVGMYGSSTAKFKAYGSLSAAQFSL